MNIKYTNSIQVIIVLAIAITTYLELNAIFIYIGFIIYVLLTLNEAYCFHIKDKKGKLRKYNKALEKCVLAVEAYQNRINSNTLRANIMMCINGELRIISSYRMENCLDRDITFSPGQGCAGHAYETGYLVYGNLYNVYKGTWEKTIKDSGSSMWGIKREHFEKTKDLKTIVSLPIFNHNNECIGVLNLDDKVPMKYAHFNKEFVHMIMKAFSLVITLEESC